MNKKYLFGMLLSGAMLAACTADDAFETAKVAENKMSAPVFTVSIDNGDLQNRAVYEPGNDKGNKVRFELDDKLSLFHGISKDQLQDDVSGYQNAIYLADEQSGNELTFHTYAMVQPGYAIMVYPADLGFSQTENGTNNTGEKAPVVTIKQVQDATQKENTPYISEFLFLEDPSKNPDANAFAGFGEEYDDVLMRRAAGTLRVTLDKTNESSVKVAEAGDIEVRAVEIAYKGSKLFSLSIPVKAGNQLTTDAGLGKAHPSWGWESELDLASEAIVTADSLKTKDIEGNVATFTILPCKNRSSMPTAGNVKVYTNYGVVTIATTSEVFGTNRNQKLDDLLVAIADGLYHKGATGETEFVGQGIGAARATGFKVDLTKLEMNGMHVANGDDLKTLLKVFNAGKCHADDEITLYLDGDDNKKFTMDAETWALAEEHMLEGDIHFVPCKGEYPEDGENLKDASCVEKNTCTTIVLQGAGDSEVPNLVFEENEVNVELEKGNWTYESATSGDKAKVISGVKEIHVTKGVHLTPSKFVAVYGESDKSTTAVKLVIDQNAFMDVTSGTVDLQVDVTNKGTITIAKGAQLRAGQAVGTESGTVTKSKTLENWSQKQESGNKAVTGLTRACGTIINKGTLGVVGKPAEKLGFVNNYGVINIDDEDATTTITNNAVANTTFADTYAKAKADEIGASDKLIGTINLKKIDDRKIDVTGEKGFIVAKVAKDAPEYSDFGGANCAANYVIFGENVKDIAYKTTTKDGAATYSNIPLGVKYIEVTAPLTNFDSNVTKTLYGLIVNKNCQFDVVKGAGIEVKAFYVEGTVNVIGTLTGDQSLNSYFGKTASTKFTGPGQNINN